MDNKSMSILDLNNFCTAEIMEYIIADCEMKKSLGNKMKFANLVNFALAHEKFEAILKEYSEHLYGSLKFLFVAKREILEIDFSNLHTEHKGKGKYVFWRIFSEAIRDNNVIHKVALYYDPKLFQPDFPDIFEIVKRALGNKKSLRNVTIRLNGYSLDDLNNFNHITVLDLNVRMNAEALVNVCKSNQHLRKLKFKSTEILGRLSDIVPHCPNLQYLKFVPKPDIDEAEYAPLAKLPNLEKMTFYGAFENGSLLTIFRGISKWQRPELQPLKIKFIECLPHLSNVTVARVNSVLCLKLNNDGKCTKLKILYNFWEISTERRPLEYSLATITLIEACLKIDYQELKLYTCSKSHTDISGIISLLKVFKIKSFSLEDYKDEIPIDELFPSMITDEFCALNSITVDGPFVEDIIEIVKRNSITSLSCHVSDWEAVVLLSAYFNLKILDIKIHKKFKKKYLKHLCHYLNTSPASTSIDSPDWDIRFPRNRNFKSQVKKIITLTISGKYGEGFNMVDAFKDKDFIMIKRLAVSEPSKQAFSKILQGKVDHIKEVSIVIFYLTERFNIEKLSVLTELEELTIWNSQDYHSEVFEKLATRNWSLSSQCLQINAHFLSTEEFALLSKIGSLKKLNLLQFYREDCISLMALAKSNIEELTITLPSFTIHELFSAFADTLKLQHLKIEGKQDRYLNLIETQELSRIITLRSLQCRCLCNDLSFLRNFKNLVKLDIALLTIPQDLQCLAELTNLESLTFLRGDIDNDLHDLLPGLYQAFASKNVKLTHLTTTIRYVEELNKITLIKSLKQLDLLVRPIDNISTSLGELPELESLQMTHNAPYYYYDDDYYYNNCHDDDDDDDDDDDNYYNYDDDDGDYYNYDYDYGDYYNYNDDDDDDDDYEGSICKSIYDYLNLCPVFYGDVSDYGDDDDFRHYDDDYDVLNDLGYEHTNPKIYMYNVLPVLRCCRNLNLLVINSFIVLQCYHTFIRDIRDLLGWIRDPTHQGPLTLIIINIRNYKGDSININYDFRQLVLDKLIELTFVDDYLKAYRQKVK